MWTALATEFWTPAGRCQHCTGVSLPLSLPSPLSLPLCPLSSAVVSSAAVSSAVFSSVALSFAASPLTPTTTPTPAGANKKSTARTSSSAHMGADIHGLAQRGHGRPRRQRHSARIVPSLAPLGRRLRRLRRRLALPGRRGAARARLRPGLALLAVVDGRLLARRGPRHATQRRGLASVACRGFVCGRRRCSGFVVLRVEQRRIAVRGLPCRGTRRQRGWPCRDTRHHVTAMRGVLRRAHNELRCHERGQIANKFFFFCRQARQARRRRISGPRA